MPRNRRTGYKAKNRFKNTMDSYVDGIGRPIFIYLPSINSECPNCYYDKKSRKSAGIPKVSPSDPNYFIVGRCPVCLGKGVIVTERRRCIHGVVIWNPTGEGMNAVTFTEAGHEGASKVQIKTDPCHLDLIKASSHVTIDGVVCKLAAPPIVRGIGNKTVLVSEFFSTSKMKLNSGEII